MTYAQFNICPTKSFNLHLDKITLKCGSFSILKCSHHGCQQMLTWQGKKTNIRVQLLKDSRQFLHVVLELHVPGS